MKQIGIRLAIRTEGEWLKAYLARGDSMEGAMLLGTLLKSIAQGDDQIWQAWKALMTSIMTGAIEIVLGERPEIKEQIAPEHERSGTG